jgi:hypothetical protein
MRRPSDRFDSTARSVGRLVVLSAAVLAGAACVAGGGDALVLPPAEAEVKTDASAVSTDGDGGGALDSGAAGPSAEFAALYRDVFAVSGAARCQDAACHGGKGGMAGLSMGEDAWDVYAAMTTYTYAGTPLVSPVPGGDARGSSALLEVVDPVDGIMPQIDDAVGNRLLTAEEWRRLEAWLATGGAF